MQDFFVILSPRRGRVLQNKKNKTSLENKLSDEVFLFVL